MSNGKGSFVTIRGQIISLESKTESLLSRYSTFAQTTSSQASQEEKSLDTQIEQKLFKRQEIVDSLNGIIESNPNISSSKLSQLQRHKEVLQDHWKNFRNIRSSIQQERNRLNLLFSVKNDIAQHSNNNLTNEDENEYIQNESRRIDQSHNMMDRLIMQAVETRESFMNQSHLLHNANNRILQTLQRVPGLNQVISKINTRRKKNAVILATVTTLCILFLFFTW
ncbi:hypothetical protein NCAS_0C05880 [Naumovozyma castellii]|uniref:Golgi SNAP receptor complex member 1 n=1 Tax=Naumovozyma castellii TaxID=27288 RepID=G0VDL6_NAUCA|nr:hypothetical protein NCAS_0C05880 [Naumovozyma castellii CBS 4309]CCC69578.1 hypothetical protein NCAS_0C05880 [Naumovozyma castellii CBS 4309]